MINKRRYSRNSGYSHQKKEVSLDDIIKTYNDTLKNQARTNFFFWYKLFIPIFIILNLEDIFGPIHLGFLNFPTGIAGIIGSVYILYFIYKNGFDETNLTKKLIIPSFVILILSISIIWDSLIDIMILLSPLFLTAFIFHYIRKNKNDDNVDTKSFRFFMTVILKVFHIILIVCIIIMICFILLLPSAFLINGDFNRYLRLILNILNLGNVLYYFNLNFLNEFKNSVSDISRKDLFRLEKEAESHQKKRYFLGMEFNKMYFSVFGFLIIHVIRMFLDYFKKKNSLAISDTFTSFFKEYGNIFYSSVFLFAILVFFILIFDNMSYLKRNTVFKNIAKVLGILIEEKMSKYHRSRKLI